MPGRAPLKVAAGFLALLATLAACGGGPGTVLVDAPRLRGFGNQPNPALAICAKLSAALPAKVDALHRRKTVPNVPTVAAWGDEPPVILRCGVGQPPGLTATSTLSTVNDVDWYTDEQPTQRVWTTFARAANVEVTVPNSHNPGVGPVVDLAEAIKGNDPKVAPPQLTVPQSATPAPSMSMNMPMPMSSP